MACVLLEFAVNEVSFLKSFLGLIFGFGLPELLAEGSKTLKPLLQSLAGVFQLVVLELAY